MGEDSCSSQITKEDSESILLVATLQSPFVYTTDQVLKQCHEQKVEKCNRLSSGPAHVQFKYVKSREKMYQALKCETRREPLDEATRQPQPAPSTRLSA